MKRARGIAARVTEQGAIAPFAAVMLVVVLGVAALATDVGAWYGERRQLQAATDAAALSAVNSPDRANEIAGRILEKNGSAGAAVTVVSTGTYCPNAELASSARYEPGIVACPNASFVPSTPNAVRVTTSSSAPIGLARALVSDELYQVSASATAARIDEAGLQAGTGLVRLDTTQSALLNLVLGNLLGTSLNLSLAQYDGLVNADLKALSFLNQLAVQLDLSVGTYDQLLQTQVQVTDLIQATIDVLQAQGQVAEVAIDGLLTLKGEVVGDPAIQLGQLLDLGVWRNLPLGGEAQPSALDAGLNVLQLVTMALQVANGKNAVALPAVTVGVPGVATLQVTATAIEPPQSPPFAFGPVGMTVHTAQVRLQLTLKLLDLFGLLGKGIQLPLYLEAAAGEATLAGIDCGDEPDTDATVTVQAKSGLARIYIGALPPNLMTNFDRAVADSDITATTLVDLSVLGILGVVRIDGKAVAKLDGASRLLTFTQTQIKNREAQSVSADPSAILASLTGDLAETLELKACGLSLFGICVLNLDLGSILLRPTLTALHQLLDPVISSVLGPLLDNVLLALGVRLGNMDVVVTGVRCGVPVLVN
ncbi:pilus assembly protein TadG-related protein [Inquilinus sp. CA228]|uniref:pilus assembly protein TadG-related protein n=1 Tax=Inquilinus sp. CA228 TaxID=3455609 RepID=UPI003F8CF746